MGRITSFSKQVIIFFLVSALIIRPTFAATVGGWSLGGGVAQGASTVYQGTKKVIIDGKDYIKKGTAIVTPTATGVAKTLAKGVAGVALSVAVEQLLGAVDWVLDPANNQIVYTPDASPTQPNPNIPKFWLIQDKYINPDQIGFSNVAAACTFLIGKKLWSTSQVVSSVVATDSGCMTYNNIGSLFGSVGLAYVSNPAYDPAKEEEKKTLPLETVAQKVISNAESGDTNAQVATGAAAADVVAEAETDQTGVKARPIVNQLENSASTKPADEAAADKANEATGEQTKNPDKPDTTDLKLEFPAFCGWAPIVCEAAQKVISFPITLTEWWETSKTKSEEWANSISESWSKVKEEYNEKPKENTDTELDIPDPTAPDINTDISFGGSCPASRSVPVSFAGISTEIEFSFQWFCEIASIAKPVIISISAFAAALIVAGVRTEDD
jgi:hypothetical protein